MVTFKDINEYKGSYMWKTDFSVNVAPHSLLQKYISNYTISFPKLSNMPTGYTIIPNASSTILVAINQQNVYCNLSCINSLSTNVGNYASEMEMLFIIEFAPGGLAPFVNLNQSKNLNQSYSLDLIDESLSKELIHIVVSSPNIVGLLKSVNNMLLKRFYMTDVDDRMIELAKFIILNGGLVNSKELASIAGYSEKHTRRLFQDYIGLTPKSFSKIVRVNHAIKAIQSETMTFVDIASKCGYFDQSHFIRDFNSLCLITPQQYREKMSLYYNNNYKI